MILSAGKYSSRGATSDSRYRNDAPSGIRLLITGLKGIRVLESFKPSEMGAAPVDRTTKANVITPAPGKQAAVTIGGGINIDELNRELRKSDLYTIGAAHGMTDSAKHFD
jgi:hypothetical protein